MAQLLDRLGLNVPGWLKWLRPYSQGRADKKQHVGVLLRRRRR